GRGALYRIQFANRMDMAQAELIALISKLVDADSCCVRPTGTSIAKKCGGPMGYRRLAQAWTVPRMSQCLRSLVLPCSRASVVALHWPTVTSFSSLFLAVPSQWLSRRYDSFREGSRRDAGVA